MKKAIIFGANGYLGRHIAHSLTKKGVAFISVGQAPISVDNYSNYEKIDVTSKSAVESLSFEVDYIFVFSGLTGTDKGFDQYQEFVKVNEIGLLNILNHHKNTKSKARIIFPSTRLVYKGSKDVFLTEQAEKEAKTIYAQNKLACEGYLKMYNNYYNIDYTIFRICVPYGNLINNSYSYGTIGFFLNKAISGENISLFGDGSLKRTFSYVGDIAEIIVEASELKETKNDVYNIGSNDNLSLLEVANLVANKFKVGVEHVEFPEKALKIESGDTMFDDNKLKKLINYDYKYQLENWLNNID